MKHSRPLLSLTAVVLAALAPTGSPGQPARDKSFALSKSDIFAPRFHAAGSFVVVQAQQGPGLAAEKVLKSFIGLTAEKDAYAFAMTIGGPPPPVVKRVFKQLHCPRRSMDGGGAPSDTDCASVKIQYTLPADPTSPTPYPDCGVRVDADVLYLGRRARTVKWELDPHAGTVVPTSGGPAIPRIRLVDVVPDPSGGEIRGITFSDNTEDEQEVGEQPTHMDPLFVSPQLSADAQSVVWTRSRGRAGVAKQFYYSVVLEVWSNTLQDYVFCQPYDPTVVNRGN